MIEELHCIAVRKFCCVSQFYKYSLDSFKELLKHCEGLGWSNTEVRWRARRQGGKERQKDLKAKVKVERGKLRSKGKKKTG